MAHDLSAFVHSRFLQNPLLEELRAYRRVEVGQGLVLIPATDSLFAELHRKCRQRGGRSYPEFRDLTPSGVGLLELLSVSSPVGYFETEYFGGAGDQRAVLYRDGHLALGPLGDEERTSPGPINAILREMGVRRRGRVDEFEALDLGSHRSTADWEE